MTSSSAVRSRHRMSVDMGAPAQSSEAVAPATAPDRLAVALPRELVQLGQILLTAGCTAYFSGQLLREMVQSGEAPHGSRADVLTDAKPHALRKLIAAQPLLAPHLRTAEGGRGVGLDLPGPQGGTRYVLLSSYRDQHPPSRWFREQKLSGLMLDLSTREVTIQAFACDVDGQLVDPYGGVRDLRSGMLRTVVPAARVFKEGGLWLLKVARFASQYGLVPAPELVRAAQRDAANILDVPRAMWKPQLDKVLLGDHVMVGLDFLHDGGVLRFLMPEVEAMIGFHKTCQQHHKDLWDHTKLVVHQAEKNLAVRWAALMHDIGKVWTRTITRDGKVQFLRHEDFGALLFEGVAARLQFSGQDTERVSYVIKQHSRVNLYDENWTDTAVRRLIRECGDRLEDLVAFSKADFTTKREHRRDAIVRQLAELEQRLAEIRELDARIPPLPKGLGTDITERFGIPPSRRIGELREWLEAKVESGAILAQQPTDYYLDVLESHRAELGLEP